MSSAPYEPRKIAEAARVACSQDARAVARWIYETNLYWLHVGRYAEERNQEAKVVTHRGFLEMTEAQALKRMTWANLNQIEIEPKEK